MAQYNLIWNDQDLLLVDVIKGDQFIYRFVTRFPKDAFEHGLLHSRISKPSRSKVTMCRELKKKGFFICWDASKYSTAAEANADPESVRFIACKINFKC